VLHSLTRSPTQVSCNKSAVSSGVAVITKGVLYRYNTSFPICAFLRLKVSI
jgi:hypothetical protein